MKRIKANTDCTQLERMHYTADGVKMEPGMVVFVDSSVIGLPPVKVEVGPLVPDRNLFNYVSSDPRGFIGAKCSIAWACPRKAMLYALMQDAIWNLGDKQ